jgi:arylsulfatase A-like enzyme
MRTPVLLATSAVAATTFACPVDTPEARAVDRLNIVLVLTDDMRADELAPMTFNDSSQWSTFTDFAVNTPMCGPSRSNLLTGRYSRETGVRGNSMANLLDDRTTIATRLDAAGYETFLVGKYLNGYPWNRGRSYVPPGWDVWQATGYSGTHQTGYEVDWRFARANQFITAQESRDATPWFAVIAPGKPHLPSDPAGKYATAPVTLAPPSPNVNEQDMSDKIPTIRSSPLLTASQLATARSDLTKRQRALMSVDDGMKALVERLRQTGELERTLIVFTSDNGYQFGSHRQLGKADHYEEAEVVPLAVRWPGTAGATSSQQLQLVDLPVTFVAMGGGAALPGAHGTNLQPLFAQPTSSIQRQWVYMESPGGAWQGVRSQHWKYAVYYGSGGGEELYDLAADPYELRNLARTPSAAGALSAARQALAQLKP